MQQQCIQEFLTLGTPPHIMVLVGRDEYEKYQAIIRAIEHMPENTKINVEVWEQGEPPYYVYHYDRESIKKTIFCRNEHDVIVDFLRNEHSAYVISF